jgi:predicted DNA-binding transcriptional regulator AlpA
MSETQTIQPLLVDAVEAARLLGISRSKLYAMHSAGLLPLPVKLGKKTLWSVSELRSWITAGTPRRKSGEKIKKEKLKLQSQKDRWDRNRNIQAALIEAVAIILVPFIGWFLNSHSNKQGALLQKNVSISSEAETKENQSPVVVTYGPNSPVNIYIAPGQ